MASGSVALDPQRVFQSYVHECERNGARGAYRRVSERYSCSAERIRQLVKQQQPPDAAPQCPAAPAEPDELAYIPPPFALPNPEPRPQPDALVCRLVLESAACEIMSPSRSTASEICQTPQTATLSTPPAPRMRLPSLVPHDFRADAKLAADVTLFAAVDVTGLCLVSLARDWRLGLMFVPLVLVAWHVAAREARTWRRMC